MAFGLPTEGGTQDLLQELVQDLLQEPVSFG